MGGDRTNLTMNLKKEVEKDSNAQDGETEEEIRDRVLDIIQGNYGITDAVQEYLNWSEEDAENADGTNWDDVVDAIMDDPETLKDILS